MSDTVKMILKIDQLIRQLAQNQCVTDSCNDAFYYETAKAITPAYGKGSGGTKSR